jgi:DNA-binding NarL/FixJ family response regulator
MISWEHFMDVKSLAGEGVSMREIARRTGLSRNTVRKVRVHRRLSLTPAFAQPSGS